MKFIGCVGKILGSMMLVTISFPVLASVAGARGQQKSLANSNLVVTAPAKSKDVQPLTVPDVTLGYKVSSDFARPASERVLGHEFNLDVETRVYDMFQIGLSLGYEYESVENEVQRPEHPTGLNDVSIYAWKKFVLDDRNSVMTSVSEILPTSELSQYEGIRSIIATKSTLNTRIYKKTVGLSTSILGSYIFNTYDKNAANLGPNPKSTVGANIGPSVNFTRSWRAAFSVGARSTQYIGSDSVTRFMNITSTTYSVQNWKFTLAYLNGSYSDQTSNSGWWVDQNRQQISSEITYDF